MFIAHLPAGYIICSLLLKKLPKTLNAKKVMLAGLLGAVFPDIDLLYFYLVDHQQQHHHHYFTHYPIVWLSILAISGLWIFIKKQQQAAWLLMIFSINACIHLIMDTLVGDIWWLAPVVDQPFALFTVPAFYQPWWLNFILHWSFLVELSLVFAGLAMFYRQKKAASSDTAF